MPQTAPSTPCSYELTGTTPAGAGAPLVVALGGISASKHVAGWWGDVVGEHRFVDTTRFQVLGIDYLDGGRGPDGRPARTVTTHDQADALVQALDDIEVARIHTLIGASYGGMVALAFAERHPERVEQLVVIGAPAKPHPMSTALRTLQRRIVELGLETGRSFDAVVLARALAMTTYRAAAEFGQRFDGGSSDAVEAYLLHHGEKFARQFSPERFLALSLSADLHRVNPTHIRTPALFVAAENDTLVPRQQMEDLAREWGGLSELVHLHTQIGHDAFLAEPTKIGGIIRNALNTTVSV